VKILLDEMYSGLKPLLIKYWPEIHTVPEVLKAGAKDKAVIDYVKENGMILVTEDCRMPRKAGDSGITIVQVSKMDMAEIIDTKLQDLQKR